MSGIYEALAKIVGEKYVSNRMEEKYFYSRDQGLMEPCKPDYIVLPKTVDEVQAIVKLACKEKIPIVVRGAGLALTGLVRPLKGGIVLDLKRMDKILEVNEKSRYAIIEAGVTTGKLKAYLEHYHPSLRFSIPDAPPSATVVGNVVIHGQGRLTQQYGFNSDMVCGLEVVLPCGDVCRIGSCSISPYWFSKGPPLPDLSGLFLGWFGTTGIITKIGIKLYPNKKIRDVEIFVTDDENLVPDIIARITYTEIVEDVNVWTQPYPLIYKGIHHITVYVTGDSEEEIEFKRKIVIDSVRDYIKRKEGGFILLTPDIKPVLLEMPQSSLTRFADVKRGGGFQYAGPIIPIEKYPEAYRRMVEVAEKYKTTWAIASRVIGRGHCMMFGFSFPFNRIDPSDMERVEKALHECDLIALELGGAPWKAEIPAQQEILKRMDQNTRKLIGQIKKLLDPYGIMNPGNWEVD